VARRRTTRANNPEIGTTFNPPPPIQELLDPVVSWPALIASVVAHAFGELGISVSVWVTGDFWYPIQHENDVSAFEYEYGVATRRWAYNRVCFARVQHELAPVIGELAGFKDLFVPILDGSAVRGILVAGPIADARSNSAQILSRWYEITSSQGRLADPSFSNYVAATLATLTLEGPLLDTLRRLMTCYVSLVSGRGSLNQVAAEAEAARAALLVARYPERMWTTARHLVEERTTTNYALSSHGHLVWLGMKRVPQHVLVGLLAARSPERDPLDELLARDAFQRACANLALELGGIAAHRIGDHGVAFLVDDPHGPSAVRERLAEVARKVAALAQSLGLRLHAGVGQAPEATSLYERYRDSLGVAEQALSRNVALSFGSAPGTRSATDLRKLRRQLARDAADRSSRLSEHFERYLQTVLFHTGHALEPTRAQLEAGLERVMEELLTRGGLDERTAEAVLAAADRVATAARTTAELAAAYRRVVLDLEATLESPISARQEHGARNAVAYIRDHVSENLTLGQVAKVAGFAPEYFSRIFKRDVGTTFENYVLELRVERAKQMLKGTKLDVEGVGQVSGFRNRHYFHRAFKRRTGMTPVEYRQRG
jgi:AraC-like DNA-binding protein